LGPKPRVRRIGGRGIALLRRISGHETDKIQGMALDEVSAAIPRDAVARNNRIGIQQATLVVRWNEKEAVFSLYDPRGKTIWWKPHLQEVIGNICENRSLVGGAS
jgi:hypothetical protein